MFLAFLFDEFYATKLRTKKKKKKDIAQILISGSRFLKLHLNVAPSQLPAQMKCFVGKWKHLYPSETVSVCGGSLWNNN